MSDPGPSNLGYLVLFTEIGFTLLATTLLGALIGNWLDGRLGSLPILSMTGFFVGAGVARLPWTSVLLWGALSACAWNALLLGLGWWVGSEWERLRGIVSAYGTIVLAAIDVLALAWLVRGWWRRRRAAA